VNNGFVTRVVFVSLLLVVAFAAIFTWIDAGSGWPDLPPHFARDVDLAVGLAFCAGVAGWAVECSLPESGELG
jgi:cytochrome bd-type quinol oxidase subunit 1